MQCRHRPKATYTETGDQHRPRAVTYTNTRAHTGHKQKNRTYSRQKHRQNEEGQRRHGDAAAAAGHRRIQGEVEGVGLIAAACCLPLLLLLLVFRLFILCQATRLPLVLVVAVPYKRPVKLWSLLYWRTASKPTRLVKRFRTSGLGDKFTVRQQTWFILVSRYVWFAASLAVRIPRRAVTVGPTAPSGRRLVSLARLRKINCHKITNCYRCI